MAQQERGFGSSSCYWNYYWNLLNKYGARIVFALFLQHISVIGIPKHMNRGLGWEVAQSIGI